MYANGSRGALAPTSESVSFGKSLAGKLAIVTGASTGLGAEIARVLALRGAHVWMCGRSEKKANAAIESNRHRMRTRRCHQSGACCSCRKDLPCPGCCCSRCQLGPRLIEDMRKSIGEKADNLEWCEVHLERMVSVKAFVDEIEATVKDFHAGSPPRVIKRPLKKDPFFASLYESEKERKKREKQEAKERKKAKSQTDKQAKKVKKGTTKSSKYAIGQEAASPHDAWVVKQRPSFSKIDLLYLNASAITQDVLLTPDGHEYTYQVNYLAHFYIVHQMLARGLLAPDSRIIVTQTESVLSGPKRSWPRPEMLVDPAAALHAAAMSKKSETKAMKRVAKRSSARAAESKKMLVYMQLELARRCAAVGSRITINGCMSGFVATDIDYIRSTSRRRLVRCLKCCCGRCCACCDIGQDLDTAAATFLWLGVSEESAQKSGMMWRNMHEQTIPQHVVGPNETAEAEWIEQKHRRKAKRAELLKTGAIIKTMPKPMVETITSQNLQLDYAALPFEERQQLEREKEDAKQHWLHTDSLAFKFWGATENYLGLETLTLDGQQTTEDDDGRLDLTMASLETSIGQDPQEEKIASDSTDLEERIVEVGREDLVGEGTGPNAHGDGGGDRDVVVVAPRVPSRWQFEGADHVANEEMKKSSADPSERLLLAMLEKDTASLQQLVSKESSL